MKFLEKILETVINERFEEAKELSHDMSVCLKGREFEFGYLGCNEYIDSITKNDLMEECKDWCFENLRIRLETGRMFGGGKRYNCAIIVANGHTLYTNENEGVVKNFISKFSESDAVIEAMNYLIKVNDGRL